MIKYRQEQYYPLYDVMKNVIGNEADPRILPVKRFKVPVDTALVRKNGTVNDEDVAATEMQFEFPESMLSYKGSIDNSECYCDQSMEKTDLFYITTGWHGSYSIL